MLTDRQELCLGVEMRLALDRLQDLMLRSIGDVLIWNSSNTLTACGEGVRRAQSEPRMRRSPYSQWGRSGPGREFLKTEMADNGRKCRSRVLNDVETKVHLASKAAVQPCAQSSVGPTTTVKEVSQVHPIQVVAHCSRNCHLPPSLTSLLFSPSPTTTQSQSRLTDIQLWSPSRDNISKLAVLGFLSRDHLLRPMERCLLLWSSPSRHLS
jgi:hypothetical protein